MLTSAPATVSLTVPQTLGSIRGLLFTDTNANGVLDSGEAPLAGRTVYLDQNQDGVLDNGELSTTTAADGSYAFTGLPFGTYDVAEVIPTGWNQTSPTSPAYRVVSVGGMTTTVFNFNELASTADQTISAYHKAGFTFDTNLNLPTKFTVFGSSNSARYAGSPALFSQSAPSTITLTHDDGTPFTLNSTNLSTVWSSVYNVTVSFTGNKADGTTVSQSFAIGSQLGFHLATFVGFNNLKSVTWSVTTLTDYHQFDDVSVQSTGSPDVTGVNFGSRRLPPVAVADNYSTLENTPLTVAEPGVLANDISPTGGKLQPVLTSFPVNGTLAFNPDGSFAYVPTTNYYGTDTFNYYVTDGSFSSSIVTDTIVVAHVNQPPTATNDSYTIDEDSSLKALPIVTSIQLTSQPGDPVGIGQSYYYDTSTAKFTVSGSAGVFLLNVAGNSTFYSNGERFAFSFSAPYGQALAPGTYTGAMRYGFETGNAPGLDVDVNFFGANTLTGQFTVYQADHDTSGHIIAFAADFEQHTDGKTPALLGRVQYRSTLGQPAGVLANDADPDLDPLTAKLVTAPVHGTLGFNPDGSFSYVPARGFSGSDQFT